MDSSEDEALSITQSSTKTDISAEIEDASRRKWAWVLKVFAMPWKKHRNEALLKQDYDGDPVMEEDIDEMSDELLEQIALKLLFRINKLMTKMIQ
ncbi:unnamed protein product [Porites evermanni]|uniref:Uncharacterized protein n=1 Tax=Porites evermanni TaxID=104178 RepID=A0ABN8SD74_9CNID|nr:unnamed protein product [Porites evermanni]